MKIGLTGGIGSGKSFVAGLLRKKGFDVFDCDKQAKMLMVNDPEVVQLISNNVGEDAYFIMEQSEPQGVSTSFHDPPLPTKKILNKKVVAQFLFKSPENASVINNIVHPRLALIFKEWARQRSRQIVFMESAILFESGFNDLVDYTVCVVADEQVRIQRTMDRDNSTYNDVVKRIHLQNCQDSIMNRCDYILYNNPKDNLSDQLDNLIHYLKDSVSLKFNNCNN